MHPSIHSDFDFVLNDWYCCKSSIYWSDDVGVTSRSGNMLKALILSFITWEMENILVFKWTSPVYLSCQGGLTVIILSGLLSSNTLKNECELEQLITPLCFDHIWFICLYLTRGTTMGWVREMMASQRQGQTCIYLPLNPLLWDGQAHHRNTTL